VNIEIIYEDSDLLVVNKPSGISVLPDGWDKEAPYLVNLLEPEFGKLWIVHRLDKITSGVFLLARNAGSHREINLQFEHHRVNKRYHAILVGNPSWKQIHANQSLKPNSGHSHRTVVDKLKGKQALTIFQVLNSGKGHFLVEASPETGRTHQIRAHAAALGHPILGDFLYGAPPTDIIPRPALHAVTIQFNHPVLNESVVFSAPYPADFQKGLVGLDLIKPSLESHDH
jgi:RluA family pseudouridine synthase